MKDQIQLSFWPNKKISLNLSPFVILILICAFAKFLIHMLTASNYGYFCDELYTIALSKHLAFGYVDLPPLVPALVALSRATVLAGYVQTSRFRLCGCSTAHSIFRGHIPLDLRNVVVCHPSFTRYCRSVQSISPD
jgi:hypothetical protein